MTDEHHCQTSAQPGSTVAVLALPDGVELDLSDETHTTEPSDADAVIAFAINSDAELDSGAGNRRSVR
jgi:hypothetical protein